MLTGYPVYLFCDFKPFSRMEQFSGKNSTFRSSSVIDILVICDVPNKFTRGCQPLCIIVRNLEPKFVFDCHDDFNVVERVQAEILHEVRIQCNFGVVNLVIEVQDEHSPLFDDIQSQRRCSTVTNKLEEGVWRLKNQTLVTLHRTIQYACQPFSVILTLTSELSIWIRCIDETFPPEFLTVWSSLRVDAHVAHDDDDNAAELDRGRWRKISLAHGNRAISFNEPERKCNKFKNVCISFSFSEDYSAVVLWPSCDCISEWEWDLPHHPQN